ncbi:MAG: Crp/Fnr family transcriptional regulator [Bacteroidales bacterium]|nr:Crp/Fnr family transcriptional regulator [Bacteroidales bacterium]
MVKIPGTSKCENNIKALNLLDKESLELINSSKIIINYKPDETIIKQGSRANQALIIQSGFTKIFVEGEQNRSLVIRYAKEGDFLGISGIFTDNIYTFSVSAVDHCKVCFVDFDIISGLIDKKPAFGRELLKLLSIEKSQMHSKFICLTQKQVPGRVANALLYLNNEVFKNIDRKLIAGRTEIAELTGMTKDSAGRVLKDFQDEGIISFSGKVIILKNIEKLEQIRNLG